MTGVSLLSYMLARCTVPPAGSHVLAHAVDAIKMRGVPADGMILLPCSAQEGQHLFSARERQGGRCRVGQANDRVQISRAPRLCGDAGNVNPTRVQKRQFVHCFGCYDMTVSYDTRQFRCRILQSNTPVAAIPNLRTHPADPRAEPCSSCRHHGCCSFRPHLYFLHYSNSTLRMPLSECVRPCRSIAGRMHGDHVACAVPLGPLPPSDHLPRLLHSCLLVCCLLGLQGQVTIEPVSHTSWTHACCRKYTPGSAWHQSQTQREDFV